MAKIESGHAEWHVAPVDLRALVEQAVATTAKLFRERGAVDLHLPERCPTLRPTPTAAAGAAEPAVQRGQVRALAGRAGAGAAGVRCAGHDGVEVQDNGPGVQPGHAGADF
jgi:hypothetical protein